METTARLRYLQASPQKVRLVADLIRGKGVEEATTILRFTKKRAARPLAKLLRSALANLENQEQHVDPARVYIEKITVDRGPMLKRARPASLGRAFPILRRQSHVTLRLAARSEAADTKTKE